MEKFAELKIGTNPKYAFRNGILSVPIDCTSLKNAHISYPPMMLLGAVLYEVSPVPFSIVIKGFVE